MSSAPTRSSTTSISPPLKIVPMKSASKSLGNSPRTPPPSKLIPPTNTNLVPIVDVPRPDQSTTVNSLLGTDPSNCEKPATIARTAGESFSPNRVKQRLNHRQYSPAVLTKIICVATAAPSFEEAAKILTITTDLVISSRHIQTLSAEVGEELEEQRTTRTREYRDRPLNTPPNDASPPIPLAAMMIDGGRMQTRKPGHGPGVHEPAWRENKTAILLRMTHAPSATDPHPDLPICFAHPLGTVPEPRLVADSATDESPVLKPQILFRTGLATLGNSEEFGWMAAAAAEERGFFSAAARAFACDGQAYNWTIHRRHFTSFEPILDFVHLSEHVHSAARAANRPGERWVAMCWRGRVSDVLSEIAEHLSCLTPPLDPSNEPEHPWCVLSREQGYLTNNQERMDYPRYRKSGLPITSSPVESWVKQLNQRVKGSEKFWNDDENAEAILQLRSAWLGDDEALKTHLENRPGHPHARPRAETRSSMAA